MEVGRVCVRRWGRKSHGGRSNGSGTEVAQLIEDLVLARSSSPDPLFREVATSEWADAKKKGLGLEAESSNTEPRSPNQIGAAKQVLHAKLSEDEYQSYLTAVLFEALKVAKAAGQPGREVSAAEAKAPGDVARDWEIDLAPLWQKVSDWTA